MYENEYMPIVTVCIPTKNRAWCIRDVLKSLEELDYPKKRLQIIFVDDYSSDDTFDIIREWALKSKSVFLDVIALQVKTNIPQARNVCIDYMNGKYLLYWDSDVIPPRGLLKEMVSLMEKTPSIGIVGADYVYPPELKARYKPVVSRETHAVYMGFTLIRREVFEDVGKFNENLSVGEDTEFCIRVKEKTRYRILWAPKPVLHLKRSEDVKRPGRLGSWLRYNFTVRAEEYYASWRTLPRFLKARILYWLLLPLTTVTGICVAIADTVTIFKILGALVPLAHISVGLLPMIRNRGSRALSNDPRPTCLQG